LPFRFAASELLLRFGELAAELDESESLPDEEDEDPEEELNTAFGTTSGSK
jgi:hypothetical protein